MTTASAAEGKIVTVGKITYRVKPSQFGGFSVVELSPAGVAVRPVRNIKTRDAAIAAALAA